MGGVAEGSQHLLVGELVGCLDVFNAVARTKGIEDRGHVDARPGQAGLAEPDVRTNRDTGEDLHCGLPPPARLATIIARMLIEGNRKASG